MDLKGEILGLCFSIKTLPGFHIENFPFAIIKLEDGDYLLDLKSFKTQFLYSIEKPEYPWAGRKINFSPRPCQWI